MLRSGGVVLVFLSVLAAAFVSVPSDEHLFGPRRLGLELPTASGSAVERSLRSGERHLYRARLEPGEVLRLTLDQKEVDVVVRLLSSGATRLARIDNPYENRRPETFLLIGGPAGASSFEVEAFAGDVAGARYRITVDTNPRPATASDRAAFDASIALSRAREDGIEPRRVVSILERALGDFRLARDPLREAEALQALGVAALAAGTPPEKAREALASSLGLFRQLETRELAVEAGLLNYLGEAQEKGSRPWEARQCYQEALDAARQAQQPLAELIALGRLGVLLRDIGELDEARRIAEEWLEQAQRQGSKRHLLDALTALASVAFAVGDYDEVERLADELELAGAGRSRRHASTAATWRGKVAYRRQQPARALEELEAAWSRMPPEADLSTRRDRAILSGWRGLALSALGRQEEALHWTSLALELWREESDRSELAAALFNHGITLAAANRAAAGLEYCDQARAMFEQTLHPSGQASAWMCRARILLAEQRLNEAAEAARRSLALVDDLWQGLRESGEGLLYRESKRAFYDTAIEILMSLAVEEGDPRRVVEALELLERSRARLLLLAVTALRDGLRRRVDPTLQAEAAQLRQRWRDERLELAGLGEEESFEERRAILTQCASSTRARYEAVEDQLRRKSAAYSALTHPRVLRLAEIQRLLGSDTQLLVYALGERRSYGWLVSAHGLTSRELPPRDAIETLARRAAALAAESESQQNNARAEEDLARLSRLLLQPFAAELRAPRLAFVLDGALQYLPWAALPLPPDPVRVGGQDQRLFERHQVVVLPSASVLAVLRDLGGEGRRHRFQSLALVGDPVTSPTDSRLPADHPLRARVTPRAASVSRMRLDDRSPPTLLSRLPYAEVEIDAISKLLPSRQVTRLVGFEARRGPELERALQLADIVHFTTHAWVDPERPEASTIVLSELDEGGLPGLGSLKLSDIYGLELSADLVVLSACRTGLGRDVDGEGLLSFTRGFMYAGVPSAVVSLWNVNDQATAELMRRFYEGMLLRRLPPAEALRRAQVSLSREPRWRRLAYWAGFTLHGDWR